MNTISDDLTILQVNSVDVLESYHKTVIICLVIICVNFENEN